MAAWALRIFRRSGRMVSLAWLVFAGPCPAEGASHPITLWQLQGAENTVYLLGTIHALRDSDYPLPSAIYAAYDDVDAIFMELDMDELDPVATQGMVNDLGMIHDDRSLRDILGPDIYREASNYASAIDIPLTMLGSAEPWLAAITVENLLLNRLGFDVSLGIEMQLLQKAQEDGKPIYGLETERQQMEILDGLSLEMQKAMLLQVLADAAGMQALLDDVIDAWRHGDAEQLESDMLLELQEYPEMMQALVSDRNEAWLARIEVLLRGDTNYMVAVGSLHLVGDGGIPALLQARGHHVLQMRQVDD